MVMLSRSAVRQTLVFGTALLLGGGLLTACAGGGEEQGIVQAFFQASRFNDRTTLGNMTMVFFDPAENGIASRVSVENVTEERRRSLRIRELQSELEDLQAEEQGFFDEKRLYQDENADVILRVIEAERDEEDVASGDEEVQEAWAGLVAREQAQAAAVSDAVVAVQAESRLASASMYDPSNPVAVANFEGEQMSKDVTVTAMVEKDGNSAEQTMVITLEKVELQGPEGVIEGRWIITAIE